MKHTHILTVNGIDNDAICYTYSFGNTKCIEMRLSKDGFSIRAELTKIYDKGEMLSGDGYLFPDGIKKGLLLYLLKFSKALEIKTITAQVDDDSEEVIYSTTEHPFVHAMIKGMLQRNVVPNLSRGKAAEYLLNTPKSKYDKRIAALFALLCSKSKEHETERFIYLWTCINGMYGWLFEKFAETKNEKADRAEYLQLHAFQQFLGEGKCTIQEEESVRIANNVIAILKRVDATTVSRTSLPEDVRDDIEEAVRDSQGKRYDITAYGYLLTLFSYYFRCKIIHGNKPVFLFSYSNDREIHSLRIVNALIEEFVDSNLHLWLDDSYMENRIREKAPLVKVKRKR